ncbi:hypothetical protein B9Z55_028534 [Caenorhabditis nigoni]|uniref:Uncharacterized protein n=1 Tax=Caenorhabditis nigoni TaxID=1611254 RepID=A0A2G5SB51_9PELO|nr:hypothetical protein B9Z55_028534 [Caenorhabditis nigoni]
MQAKRKKEKRTQPGWIHRKQKFPKRQIRGQEAKRFVFISLICRCSKDPSQADGPLKLQEARKIRIRHMTSPKHPRRSRSFGPIVDILAKIKFPKFAKCKKINQVSRG